jgi:hypothetical protein
LKIGAAPGTKGFRSPRQSVGVKWREALHEGYTMSTLALWEMLEVSGVNRLQP